MLRDQGGNILIIMFCGATVNAARGIAMSVNSAVYGFVANFMIALNPQITKNYASGDYGYMFSLAFQGARLSYYILLILSLPIFVTTPYLLHLWLGIVPDKVPTSKSKHFFCDFPVKYERISAFAKMLATI